MVEIVLEIAVSIFCHTSRDPIVLFDQKAPGKRLEDPNLRDQMQNDWMRNDYDIATRVV